MDYPTAWEFVRETKPEQHHAECSWRVCGGALLCDCHVLMDEYKRRSSPNGGEDAKGGGA